MSPVEVARAIRWRLAEEIARDHIALDTLAKAIESLLEKATDERGEWMRALALAFQVERYFTAVEALLVRVLRTLDGDVPSGATWHLELLRAAGVPLPGGRPVLLNASAAKELHELLKFRHLARHGYETEPELARMEDHARTVQRAHAALSASLTDLDGWLRRE